MINKMLIKQPITDGSSEYTVRIPNMTEWEQNEVLATESYVNNKCNQTTTLYKHCWHTNNANTIPYNIYWVSNSSTKVTNVIGLRDALTTAISVWVVEAIDQQDRYNAFSVYKNLHLHLIIEKDVITETIFTTDITHIEVEDLIVSTNSFTPYTPERL